MTAISSVAALLIVNAYCCVLLGLIWLALDPTVDWSYGFLGLMVFFCVFTRPSHTSNTRFRPRSVHSSAGCAPVSLVMLKRGFIWRTVRFRSEQPPMRISFDVDDTLVCGSDVPTEQLLPWWWKWRYGESIRWGTRALMLELARQRHELWIYITSYRSPRYLRGWLAGFGVTLAGVVNQHRHDRNIGRSGPSKLPPAFGIDLHVDDSEGVAEEGRRHGFDVIVVAPDDIQWTARVLEAIEARARLGGSRKR